MQVLNGVKITAHIYLGLLKTYLEPWFQLRVFRKRIIFMDITFGVIIRKLINNRKNEFQRYSFHGVIVLFGFKAN